MMADESAPAWLDVSRETLADLQAYCRLVEKWNPAVNLVSRSTIPDVWTRHLLDSAQIYCAAMPCTKESPLWCDLGSGGGFPGLVVAILAKADRPDLKTALIESDQRKAVFLKEVARTLGLDVQVHVARLDQVVDQGADVVSARALAPLVDLCGFAHKHLAPGGFAVFPKGATVDDELAEARRCWSFELETIASKTDSVGQLLLLREIRRV